MLPKQIILVLFVDACLSYGTSNIGVKGGRSQQGVKSYGGYFPDSGLPDNFVHSPEYHRQQQPNYYQPYGWNYNQPTRTYGGVMQPSYQNSPQGFGWFGGENQFGSQNNNENNDNGPASFPKTPSLFLPNFAPNVYFPNAPYPQFPNFNFNQFPHGPYNPYAVGQGGNNQAGGNQFGGQFPQQRPHSHGDGEHQGQGGSHQAGGNNQNGGSQFPQQPSYNRPQQPGHGSHQNNFGQYPQPVAPLNPQPIPNRGNDQQPQSTNDDKFLTNAFFGSNHGGGQWTEDDEMRWQATTKAPYFENKVPGLECTLPASAVLGATTALKASSLLPLNVPIGKPILSCNATELLQAQINLNGIIYDCRRSAITMSCPRVDSNGLVQDECQGETLECDVRMRQNSRSVSCTNGTLISNHPIVCKSATLMETKNVLNCLYKGMDGELPHPSSPRQSEHTTRRPSSPEQTTQRMHPTARPVIVPDVSILPPLGNEADNDVDDVHIRFSSDKKKLETLNLQQEVQKAMDDVFPIELLSVPSRRMYLPPKFSKEGQSSDNLKEHLNGVFPHELLSILQTDEANTNEVAGAHGQGLSLNLGESNNREDQASFTQQRQSQWDVNVNRKTGNPGSSIKTSQITARFGGVTESYDDDRLIFSS